MQSVLVHGFHDARDASDSLYLVARSDAITDTTDIGRSSFLADSLIAQIDTAFRRVSGLKATGIVATEDVGVLSGRENEILAWVSEGRTNCEISALLALSPFTVKNHMHRIMKKLGVANRTEAAAKYRRLPAGMRGKIALHARGTAARGGDGLASNEGWRTPHFPP